MIKRIPIQAAKDIAKKFNMAQVILVCWEVDEKQRCAQTHVVTYGKTKGDCLQAAQGGNMVKKALGWPDTLCSTVPARARKDEDRKQACMAALMHLMVRPENRLPDAEENVKSLLREAIGIDKTKET